MPPISIPTTAALSSTQLVAVSHPSVVKTLQRLSRPSLLSLVLDWLDERNRDNTSPYLAQDGEEQDDQDLYPPCSTLEELRELYTEMQAGKGGKRDVVDRILEGDWREGITLYQLAMADMQYLYDHPSSQKWTALKVVRLATGDPVPTNEQTKIPRFHPATFLQNLQSEGLPDVKAHYNLDRHTTLPLLILRIYIVESPYNTALALQPTTQRAASFDASRTFYIAFPDASPYVYVSLTTTTASTTPNQGSISDNRSLRKLTLEGIPKAFSRPRERYKLETTSLSARNLEALCEKRGGGRTNAAGGGWGLYADEGNKKDNPLNINVQLPSPDPTIEEPSEEPATSRSMKRKPIDDPSHAKRRKLVAQGRFGGSARPDDGKGIERLDVRLEDPFPNIEQAPPIVEDAEPEPASKKRKGRRSTINLELERPEDDINDDDWRPDIRITFQGSHIFAGIRELVEAGVIDGERMPGWMTGEEGVSIGIVRDGRIKGHKGSGL